MMKYVFILFPVLLIAQPNKDILFLQNYQKATVLNGASQYWSKTSPNSFDFGTTVDFLMIAVVKNPAPTAGNQRIISKSASPNARIGFGALATSGVATFFVSDGTTSVNYNSTTNICDNRWHVVAVTADRDGNATIYVDGVVSGTPTSIAGVGSLTAAGNLEIGTLSAANYWTGLVGAVQIVRFATFPSDIAQIVAQVSSLKKPLGAYQGGQIVAWYDWSSGGTDKSGSGNHLTPVNNPIIVNAK